MHFYPGYDVLTSTNFDDLTKKRRWKHFYSCGLYFFEKRRGGKSHDNLERESTRNYFVVT